MLTRPVDMDDAAEFHRWYEIHHEAEIFERPADPPLLSEHEAAVMFSEPDPAAEVTAYASFDGDTMVASGFTAFTLLDNTDKGFVAIGVAPPLRRRGLGSAALSHVIEVSRRAGRNVVLSQAWLPFSQRGSHPYRLFAEKNGFTLADVEIRRDLPLPVPLDRLGSWRDEAAPSHVAYRLETYVDDVPDPRVDSFCRIMNQLATDAPTGDVEFEEEETTPTTFRQRQVNLEQMNIATYITLAVDSSGETAAYTTLAIPRDRPGVVNQWGTLVHRDHRGHRLGLAVKAANLMAVQEAFPDRTFVTTCNAETNTHMVDINERMGFGPVEVLAVFQRRLPGGTATTGSS